MYLITATNNFPARSVDLSFKCEDRETALKIGDALANGFPEVTICDAETGELYLQHYVGYNFSDHDYENHEVYALCEASAIWASQDEDKKPTLD